MRKITLTKKSSKITETLDFLLTKDKTEELSGGKVKIDIMMQSKFNLT